MEKQKNQWHPGFTAAIRMELKENQQDLEFLEEHNLSKKPLQIDLLIVKNLLNVPIKNKIGKMFKRYNIVEYKSPDDELGVDVYYKTIAYACLYKASGQKENEYKASDITITLIRQRYPKKLMEYLIEEGYQIREVYSGIYYLEGRGLFDTQIIVSKQLESEEHIWLHSLQKNISRDAYQRLLYSVGALQGKEKEEYGDAVLRVVSTANKDNLEKWKEDEEMCEALREIMAPELEAERREGKILAYAEMGLSLEEISGKVALSVDEVKEILNKNK